MTKKKTIFANPTELKEAAMDEVQGGALSKLQHDTAMTTIGNGPKNTSKSASFVADSFSFGDG